LEKINIGQDDLQEIKSLISNYEIKDDIGLTTYKKLQAFLNKQMQEGGI